MFSLMIFLAHGRAANKRKGVCMCSRGLCPPPRGGNTGARAFPTHTHKNDARWFFSTPVIFLAADRYFRPAASTAQAVVHSASLLKVALLAGLDPDLGQGQRHEQPHVVDGEIQPKWGVKGRAGGEFRKFLPDRLGEGAEQGAAAKRGGGGGGGDGPGQEADPEGEGRFVEPLVGGASAVVCGSVEMRVRTGKEGATCLAGPRGKERSGGRERGERPRFCRARRCPSFFRQLVPCSKNHTHCLTLPTLTPARTRCGGRRGARWSGGLEGGGKKGEAVGNALSKAAGTCAAASCAPPVDGRGVCVLRWAVAWAVGGRRKKRGLRRVADGTVDQRGKQLFAHALLSERRPNPAPHAPATSFGLVARRAVCMMAGRWEEYETRERKRERTDAV